jgi:hypothetical protein
MPGRRSHTADSSYVTDIASYREGISADDGDVVDIAKQIDMRLEDSGNPNQNGRESSMFVYAKLGGSVTGATIELWTPVDLSEFPLESEEGEASSSSPAPTDWYLVASKAITQNERIHFPNLVPSVYRLRVSSKAGAGEIDLHEQHSE